MHIHTRQGEPGKGGMDMRYGLRALACATALAGLLVGCGDQEAAYDAPAMSIAPDPAEALKASLTTAAIPVADTQQHYIAYTHEYEIKLPAGKRTALSDKHRRLCEAAGPAQCQIEWAYRHQWRRSTTLKLDLRATPKWMSEFAASLPSDIEAAGGQISSHEVKSENLAQQVIDTEAYIRARTTLRDRLEGLLATRTGKLGELLEIERELARVQGELDSARSRLEHMRSRIAMAKISLTYESTQLEGGGLHISDDGYFVDLWREVKDSSLTMIQTTAIVLPWLIPLGLLVWGLRRLWAARKRAKLAAKAAADTAAK